MRNSIKFIALGAFLAIVQPTFAGQRLQVSAPHACFKSLTAPQYEPGGIATGQLARQLFAKTCSGEPVEITFHSSQFKIRKSQKTTVKPAKKSKHALPDGLTTTGNKNIAKALLTRPTQRYNHAILGDNIEAGGMAVEMANRRQLEIRIAKTGVFEDRLARLVDLDNDGRDEIIVIHSDRNFGASVAVYGVAKDKIARLAQNKAIGLSHRWLNLAAAADFDGNGQIELAWVETPHIGGILKIARLTGTGTNRNLSVIARLPGFSNHTIGDRELHQSATFDWDGDGNKDIILPDARRRTIRVVSFNPGKLRTIDEISIDGILAGPFIATDLAGNGNGELFLTTKNGRILVFKP